MNAIKIFHILFHHCMGIGLLSYFNIKCWWLVLIAWFSHLCLKYVSGNIQYIYVCNRAFNQFADQTMKLIHSRLHYLQYSILIKLEIKIYRYHIKHNYSTVEQKVQCYLHVVGTCVNPWIQLHSYTICLSTCYDYPRLRVDKALYPWISACIHADIRGYFGLFTAQYCT